MMLTLFQVEKKQNTDLIMNFKKMQPEQLREWFRNATTRIKSYTRKSYEEIAKDVSKITPSMTYDRIRIIRAKPKDPTRAVTPYPSECEAIVKIYGDKVPGLLTDEEMQLKDEIKKVLEEKERLHRKLTEALNKLTESTKENELLKRENDLSSREIEILKSEIDRLKN